VQRPGRLSTKRRVARDRGGGRLAWLRRSRGASAAPPFDSETLPHQIGVHLQRMLGGSVRLVARGVSGATIRQVAEHQVAALAGVDADAVVISAGSTTPWHGAAPTRWCMTPGSA
jgi:hypothetical protein